MDRHRLSPWVRMLLASLVRNITRHRGAESATSLGLHLCEFASLGRVKIIHEILRLDAHRGTQGADHA